MTKTTPFLLAAILALPIVSAASQKQVRWAVLPLAVGESNDLLPMAISLQKAIASLNVSVLTADDFWRLVLGPNGTGPLSADLNRLRGLFKKGYANSYDFRFAEAVQDLELVLEGLQSAKDTTERWALFRDTCIFLGRSYAGLKQFEAARRAFLLLLRTRPSEEPDRKLLPPKFAKLWAEAQAELAEKPRGKLAVTTEPTGVEVWLDGVRVGTSDYADEHPHGRYFLALVHPSAGRASRWVDIGSQPTEVAVAVEIEGCLDLTGAYPALRRKLEDVPNGLWPWLGARLGAHLLATVQALQVDNRPRWIASLVDLETGRIVREGWLERRPETDPDAADLANFLVKGDLSRVVSSSTAPPAAPLPEPTPSPRVVQEASPPREIEVPVPAVTAASVRRSPLRTWWPWAIAGAAVAFGGMGLHLYSISVEDSSPGLTSNADQAGMLLRAGIGCYIAAGAIALVGAILHLTWSESAPVVRPALSPESAGFSLELSF